MPESVSIVSEVHTFLIVYTDYSEDLMIIYRTLCVKPVKCAGQCLWLDLDVLQEVVLVTKSIFPVVAYAQSSVPTYPTGTIGYLLASKNKVFCYTRGSYRTSPPPQSLFSRLKCLSAKQHM